MDEDGAKEGPRESFTLENWLVVEAGGHTSINLNTSNKVRWQGRQPKWLFTYWCS